MSEAPVDLVLEHLRAIRSSLDTMATDIREIKALIDRIEALLGLVEA